MVTATFAAQVGNSGFILSMFVFGLAPEYINFWLYLYWTITVFFMIGLTIGNLNALALEPMGHIAGMASSIVAALATVLSVLVAVPIGLAFDGTPVPLMAGVLGCSLAGLILMKLVPRPDAIG
jgi:DHA1 family bicyclomycin/chloramphenicol resistance-like MFS transporter